MSATTVEVYKELIVPMRAVEVEDMVLYNGVHWCWVEAVALSYDDPAFDSRPDMLEGMSDTESRLWAWMSGGERIVVTKDHWTPTRVMRIHMKAV